MPPMFRSLLILLVGMALGLALSIGATVWTHEATVHVAAARSPAVESPTTELVTEVMDRVKRDYVDAIDDRRLADAAIRGILGELDDHSKYLDPDQYEEMRISTSGNYTGVGLDVSVDDGKLTVVSPLDGAPAARAGILPGDVLVSVDNQPVDAHNLEATVSRMRGEAGTEVTLGVMRHGEQVPIRFALTRAEVQVHTVSGEYLGNGLGYIRLSGFAETTPRELLAVTGSLQREAGKKLLGVVLDLRGNPGGVLDAAVQVADAFLAGGLIVRGTGRVRQARFEQYAHSGDELEDVPAVVLVNGGSASASEIVAGALQDHHRARIVGERTYGKGSVQTVMPLGEGRALKLTTSRYLTPSGRSINGIGIDPDVVVHNTDPKHEYHGAGGAVALRDDAQLLEAIKLVSYDSIAVSRAP
jgi:carboxyl-terminal processing protease